MNLFSKVLTLPLQFQLYDRISSRVPTPTRAPSADAVQRAREVEEILREAELSAMRNVDRADLRELRDLLVQPHLKVSIWFGYLVTQICDQAN